MKISLERILFILFCILGFVAIWSIADIVKGWAIPLLLIWVIVVSKLLAKILWRWQAPSE